LTERLKFLEIQKQLYQRELSETEGLNIVNPDYEKALKLIKEDINSVKREQLEDLLDKLDNDRKKIEDDLEKYNTLTLFNSGMANEMETVESRVKDLEDALDANIKSREVVKERLNTIGQKRSKVLVDFIEKLKIVLAEAYRILTETADYKVFGHADLYLENQ
jgi:translation initiation factor 2B subunit (eIF-2B alpha/beta/delta family)